jgi:hypothetical protein
MQRNVLLRAYPRICDFFDTYVYKEQNSIYDGNTVSLFAYIIYCISRLSKEFYYFHISSIGVYRAQISGHIKGTIPLKGL